MREVADILKVNEKAVFCFSNITSRQSFQSQKQLGLGLVRAQALADLLRDLHYQNLSILLVAQALIGEITELNA